MTGGLNKTNRYLLAGASVIGILAVSGTSAKATDVAQLEAAMKAMQAQMAVLQKQVQEAKAAAASAQTAASAGGGSDLDLKVKWKGAPELSSSDGKFKFKVRGRVETEYENVNQDTAITSFPDISATELRRARLGVEGVAFYDVKYILEVDFANDAVAVKDAYLQYQGVKFGDTPLNLRVGNFRTPNSFELQTSELFVDTLERANFINAWQLDRQVGFMAAYWTDHWGVAGGIFGDRFPSANASTPLFAGFIGDEDLTFAARATVAPINRELNGVTQVLHFGASVRTRDAGDDQPLLQYQGRGADLHMTNFVVNTGRIGESDTFWGLEAVGLWGPFSAQAEYGHLDVDLPSGAFLRSNPPSAGQLTTINNPFVGIPDPTYNAWYVEGSWFFGGRQVYNKEGKWDRPKIFNPMRWSEGGGWGALQLVGKYDVLDLSDNAFNTAFNPASTIGTNGSPSFVGGCPTTRLYPNIANSSASSGPLQAASIAQCGEMKTWSIGANWYLNDYVRLMFQYSESDLGNYPVTNVNATGTQHNSGQIAGFDGATIRGFGMRAQVDW